MICIVPPCALIIATSCLRHRAYSALINRQKADPFVLPTVGQPHALIGLAGDGALLGLARHPNALARSRPNGTTGKAAQDKILSTPCGPPSRATKCRQRNRLIQSCIQLASPHPGAPP